MEKKQLAKLMRKQEKEQKKLDKERRKRERASLSPEAAKAQGL